MNRKCIAVVASRADGREQREFITDVLERAKDLDVDVVVFSNLYDYNSNDRLLTYENIIYDYLEPELFDGIVISLEAFYNRKLKRRIYNKIKESGVKAVVLSEHEEGFMSVNSDDEYNFDEIVRHIVICHGKKNIDVIGGPIGDLVAEKRDAAVKTAFLKYGVKYDEKNIHRGDFWYTSGEEIGEKYVSGELPMPEAVICTNDYIAYGLCNVLTQHGVKIPDEITVTGYDYVNERIYNYPILTSFDRGRKDMGSAAVDLLFPNNLKKKPPSNQLVLGNSCKCGVDVAKLSEELRGIKILRYHNDLSSISSFSSKLTACRSIQEYMNVIKEHFDLLQGSSSLYLCSKKHNDQNNFICSRITSQKVYSPINTSQDKLLETLLNSRHSWGVYYLSPLTFQTSLLGFTALHFEYPMTYDESLRNWNANASNALEMLRMKNNISYLKQCQSVSMLYDSLTGFYKFEEFTNLVDEFRSYSKLSEQRLLSINLNFASDEEFTRGGSYRTEIISNIASAIKKACFKHEVYTRVGEGHFIVLSAEIDTLFSDRIRSFVEYTIRSKYYDTALSFSFNEYIGEVDVKRLYKFVEESAEKALLELNDLKRRMELPHFKDLCQVRVSIYDSPQLATNVTEICKKLFVSIGHFRVIYKNAFGTSYLQDIINAKVLYAKLLLCTSSMSIFSIAKKCGYNDEKYFARQFGQSANCSPAQYRADIF